MDLIQKIKEALPLEKYMEESGIQFTRRSKESWAARCWRHVDQTPSLVVSTRKGLYNCFSTGCGAGGDVITFHEQYHNCDRSVAVRALAEKLGIRNAGEKPDRTQELMRCVTELFAFELFNHKKVMDYVRSRGVSEETCVEFQVGYSPSALWIKRALGEDADPAFLRSLELDSFKYEDALVLPCMSPVSGAIAHYVRPFRKSSSKYMGPSASNPSRWPGMMFGLQVARRYVREQKNRYVLVEGQFDCLALHSGGFTTTVCMLGSNPTQDQLAVFKSIHAPRVCVLFDGDPAGVQGAEKALSLFGHEVPLSIAILPGGDPDEYLAEAGPQKLREIVDHALLPVDYIINKWKGSLDGNAHQIAEGLKGATLQLSGLSRPDFLAGLAVLGRQTGVPAECLLDLLSEAAPDLRPIVESERQVLAMCLKDPSASTLASQLPDDVWTLSRNRQIYKIIGELLVRGASRLTPELLSSRLADPTANGAVSSLFALEASNLDYHIGQLKEAYVRRKLVGSSRKLALEAADGKRSLGDVVTAHLAEISRAASPTGKAEFSADEVVESAIEYVHERMANPDKIPGLALGPGWASTTKILLGLQRNRLYLVGAGPKVGKTSLALGWAYNLAVKTGVPTLWVNLEMSERDLMMRLFSISSGLSSLRVQAGALGAREKELLDSHAAEIYSSPFHIFNAFGLTVQEIIAGMRKYVYSHAVSLTFIDYIQLMNVSGGSRLDYWERHAQISTDLKGAINANLGIPVVALSQLGRPAASEGSSSGSFIGGSYKYVQDCDVFMGLRLRSGKELEDGMGGTHVLNVEYNRHGPQDVYTRIHFDRNNLRMEEAT